MAVMGAKRAAGESEAVLENVTQYVPRFVCAEDKHSSTARYAQAEGLAARRQNSGTSRTRSPDCPHHSARLGYYDGAAAYDVIEGFLLGRMQRIGRHFYLSRMKATLDSNVNSRFSGCQPPALVELSAVKRRNVTIY
jgi:hypothetical protein